MADHTGRWLENIGLSKYADVFAENEIDFPVLPDLSETDFEKIGIPMGPCKKMLQAIEEFNVAAQGTGPLPGHELAELQRRRPSAGS